QLLERVERLLLATAENHLLCDAEIGSNALAWLPRHTRVTLRIASLDIVDEVVAIAHSPHASKGARDVVDLARKRDRPRRRVWVDDCDQIIRTDQAADGVRQWRRDA